MKIVAPNHITEFETAMPKYIYNYSSLRNIVLCTNFCLLGYCPAIVVVTYITVWQH